MIRVCADCRRFLGIKRPWFNWSITHGLCRVCFQKVMQQMDPLRRAELKALDNDLEKMLEDAP